MQMDDLDEIRIRIEQLEAGLAEVKELVRKASQPSAVAAISPPPAAGPAAAAGTGAPVAAPRPAAPAPSGRPFPAPPPYYEKSRTPGTGPPASGLKPPAPPPAASPSPGARLPGTPPAPAAAIKAGIGKVVPPRPARSSEMEANLVASWFARIGAFAVFLGAAFAFRYAVDRNLITPAGRVAVGVLAGLAFVGWGEWTRRKQWPLFAQAVAGAGVAITYLSVWAGYQLYDLTSPGMTLALLALVVAAGGALALRHDSMVLAIMATLGGFVNPLLVQTGRGSLVALYLYLLVLNTGVLGLAYARNWRGLSILSVAATWLLALGSLPAGPDTAPWAAIGFATAFFLLFEATLLLRYRSADGPAAPIDLTWATINAVAFGGFGLLVLTGSPQALLILVLGLFHLALSQLWRTRKRSDTQAILTFAGTGVAAATLAVALQFSGPVLATVWAVEAVLIMMAATRAELSRLRIAAFGVFGLSVGLSLLGNALGVSYQTPRPLFSAEALPFAVQIAALGGATVMLRRRAGTPQEQRAADTTAVLGNLLAVVWFTFELWAHYQRPGVDWTPTTLVHAVAALWALYGLALVGLSFSRTLRWAQIESVFLLGLSMMAVLSAAGMGPLYRPERALFSVQSGPWIIQIGALAAIPVLTRRFGPAGDQQSGHAGAVVANLWALLWLTFELGAMSARGGWSPATFPYAAAVLWALYAATIGAFGAGRRAPWAKPTAAAVFGVSLAATLLGSGAGAAYAPGRVLVSVEALAFALQVAILGAAAVLIRRRGQAGGANPDAIALGANVLALLWLTFEVSAHFSRPGSGWTAAHFAFALSTVWTLYAAGLMGFGIGMRARWARLASVWLFGLVIAKLVFYDVWLLETPLRIAAFMGLGFVMLACSLGYHRFRALILGPPQAEPPTTPAGRRPA